LIHLFLNWPGKYFDTTIIIFKPLHT
jgi:hypothetical protein